MKRRVLYTIAGLLSLVFANAANYYLSTTIGDDSRTSIEAQDPNTPWQSLKKLNAVFSTFAPGDSVFLRRGDVFYGSINVLQSGMASLPIVITAYGEGAKPVITGFVELANWTAVGKNVWETSCSSCGPVVNMVVINGVNQRKGRYPNLSEPNGGYLTLEAHSGNTQITDKELSASANWTNAEVVIRKNRWIIDRHKISNHSGSTISYLPNPATNYEPTDNFGYFIQNHPATLDDDGEWYYDPSKKKIMLYYTGDPSLLQVKATAIDLLVTSYGPDNIVFDNIALTGANVEAFELYNAGNFRIKNCDISFVGYDGIYAENLRRFRLENCTIADANNDAVYLANNCSNSIISNNKITRTAIYPGSGYSGFSSYQGLTVFGDGNIIQHNQVDSTGYSAISFIGSNNLVKNNVISHFALVKDDAAGIYTWAGELNGKPITGRRIVGNIVLRGIGAPQGTNNPAYIPADGIYMDDKTTDVEITGNTVAFCSQSGLFLHNAAGIRVINNTFYDNNRQWYLVHDNIAPNNPIRDLVMKANILFSNSKSRSIIRIQSIKGDINDLGIVDSNFYCRPVDTTNIISAKFYNTSLTRTVEEFYSLDTWKRRFGKDSATTMSPATAGDTILFEFNPTGVAKRVSFIGRYIDVRNKPFVNAYRLPPYSSVILIKKGAKVAATSPALVSRTTSHAAQEETFSATLFPNPTTSGFRLLVQSQSTGPIDIAVYSSDGRKMQQLRSASLQNILIADKLPPGIYHVEVRQENRRTIVRGVKQ